MNDQLKYLFRSFQKKPVFSGIIFSGFAISILAGLLIYLWVFNEFSYEKFHPDNQNIYRILTLSKQGDQVVKSADNYQPVAMYLKNDYPQIENATYISFSSETSPLQWGKDSPKIEALRAFTDNDFFKIFKGFTFVEGNASNAFAKPQSIVLSKQVAHKLFGNQSAYGKQILIDKYFKQEFTVSGVVDIPSNSHINFGYLLPRINLKKNDAGSYWYDKHFTHVYIKLNDNARITTEFLNGAANVITHYSGLTDKLMFQPLNDIHLYSDYKTSEFDRHIGNIKYVWIFSGFAFLLLLMAALNFSILSGAHIAERTTEFGVKKINGASHFQIVRMFFYESFVFVFMATLTALLITAVALPWFNHLTGQAITFHINGQFSLNIFLLIFILSIVSSVYPSLVLSSFSPLGIIKGNLIKRPRYQLTNTLLTIQFGISFFLLVATFMVVKQINFIQHNDLGFDHSNIVVVPTGLWYDDQMFKDELLKNPNVFSVSASADAPVDFTGKTKLSYTHVNTADSLETTVMWVDKDFASTYHLQVTKGTFLQDTYNDYWARNNEKIQATEANAQFTLLIPIVINETAERLLGFTDPIGKKLGNYYIIGVVKDFNFQTLRHGLGPIILENNPECINVMNINIAPNNKAATLHYIQQVYKKFREQREFSYHFFDDLLAEQYAAEMQLKNTVLIFSMLAFVIAMLGVFGMSWFTIKYRTKEIGIRKVNGAQTKEVLVLLNKDFVKWIVVSFVLASPISYYALHKWLESFAYKTNLSWWIFALSGCLSLLIALLTVSWQSWRAATRNPVEALRCE